MKTLAETFYNRVQFAKALNDAGLQPGTPQGVDAAIKRGEFKPTAHDAKGSPLFAESYVRRVVSERQRKPWAVD